MKFAFIFLKLLSHLPHIILRGLAHIFSWLCYWLVVPRRKVGLKNLELCFPEKTEAERKHILHQHFYHMALLVLEYGRYWYADASSLKNAVRYQDKAILDEALQRGEKVILLYPHFTAFEAAVYALNQEVPLISVYSHQKNAELDEQILRGRHRYNNVFLIGRTEGLRSIIKQIRSNNAPFLYLPDQDFGEKDSIFVDFFNIPTATITGLSRIAKMTDAKVIPAIPTRQKDGTVILRFYPTWDNFPTEDAVADTRRMNAFIEERIREMPEQYYWLHKRFKTRPDGEKSFYS
ncbi:lipid A biosynthesis lauroyl acyltransferase [Kingella negevensis]|uniref:lipid A biosynthesis lauroyl acyltransferase n=1 Tax=Kingella negevensis TaxID=1522312 RepID=UPI00050A2949|nr:lipid A biosynthesis lauroyl acyltransferase [Kingella negevensis]MDK4689226.1 lipid A biosynthesis lauroyl acyltransferase [Kingella negevensis]MDK4708600.1 lipid A biosynthesis lauroyl acyltransferase [Kingella negevensis]MDK4710371.1 lipid A biosynthesis lauroyl acyltransferase [Kingella negevensis]WII91419.1 lipid A biosynthesis lauroyl acyltransferase [Kingella negevensis]WII92740.1 lipid A biosynthesis lauroyl acyltransferase [Kingella negevensis]